MTTILVAMALALRISPQSVASVLTKLRQRGFDYGPPWRRSHTPQTRRLVHA